MILVVAGTSEGKEIVSIFLKNNYKVIATVTTGYGAYLLPKHKNLTIIEGKLSKYEFIKVLQSNKIKIICDASHPFATEVTTTLLDISDELNLKYLRYEREKLSDNFFSKNIIKVKTYNDAVNILQEFKGNILLTTGSKNLEIFTKKLHKEKLFVRVLPLSKIIRKCELLGLSTGNILAAKGPFSIEFNIEHYRLVNAGIVVTKESGSNGGVENKILAAKELNIPVVIIERDHIIYPEKISDYKLLLNKIRKYYEN